MDNYKLYRKHRQELFEMFHEVIINSPTRPFWGFDTQEEEDEYNKKMNEYLVSRKQEIMNRLNEMGFGPHDEQGKTI